MMRNRRRGFTLIELMVSSVITLTIMAAVAATFIGVQGAYQNEAQVKGSVEGGRTALGYLQRTLTLAGYGIPPERAFDFTPPTGFNKDNDANTTVDFVTDDLAFRFRDPVFLRRGTLAGTTVTLPTGTMGAALRSGQGFLVACRGGRAWALGRTSSALTDTSSTATLSGIVTPPGVATTDRCFTDNTAEGMPFVMLVHERRFRVVSLDSRPFLVVFHNWNAPDPVTNTDYEPLASDVEQFQVAYGMNRPTPASRFFGATPDVDAAGNGNWVLMDAAGEALPSTVTAPPLYATNYDDPLRYNNSVANIRSVRVSMVLRSTGESKSRRQFARERLENAAAWTKPADGYYRYTLRSTIRTPNMNSRTFFNPPVRVASSTEAELNHNGG